MLSFVLVPSQIAHPKPSGEIMDWISLCHLPHAAHSGLTVPHSQ